MSQGSERVGPMCPHHEDELHAEFTRILSAIVPGEPVLAPHLAELAHPVGQERGTAAVELA